MKNLKQFTNIIDVLRDMPPDKKEALIRAHKEFHRLCSLCGAKKEIEMMPGMAGIKVLQKTLNVQALKDVIDYLKPAGFKWEDTPNIPS